MALRIARRLPRLAVVGVVLLLASATLAVGAAKRLTAVPKSSPAPVSAPTLVVPDNARREPGRPGPPPARFRAGEGSEGAAEGTAAPAAGAPPPRLDRGAPEAHPGQGPPLPLPAHVDRDRRVLRLVARSRGASRA